jgi:type VI secretion system VgrG family protein
LQFQFKLNIQNNIYTLLTLHGTEALSRPFAFTMTFKVPIFLNDCQLLGQSVSLSIYSDHEIKREIVGVITQSSVVHYLSSQEKLVGMTLSPKLTLLKEYIQPHVFLNQSIIDITENILTQHANYATHQIKWQLRENYPTKPLTVQVHQESDFDFLQRLLARVGIFYYFTATDHQEYIIFTDQNIQLPFRQTQLIYQIAHGLANTNAVYQLTLRYKTVTDQFVIRDYNENTPDINIHAKANTFPGKQVKTIQDIYGMNTKNYDTAKQLADLYTNRAQVESFEIAAKSHQSDLFSGFTITLNTFQFPKRLNGRYLITMIKHVFKNSFYYNQFKCIPYHITYRSKIPDHPFIPFTLPAKVEGFEDHAHLDDQGRYQIRYCFDESNTPRRQASPPVRRMLSYNGPQSTNDTNDNCVGIHFPLQNNTEVLLSCLHADPDRPFILASLPNSDHLSPVNSNNPTQNQIVTRSGHTLILEDDTEHQYIALHTYGHENELRMVSNLNENNISLTSSKGYIHLCAQRNCRQMPKADLEEIINANRKHIIQHTHSTSSKTGHLHYQIHTTATLRAHEDFYINSGQFIEITSGHHIQFNSKKNTVIKTPQMTAQSLQEKLNICGSNVTFSTNSTAHIHAGGAGIIMQPNGTIILYGQSVTGSITYGGNVIRNPTPIPCPSAPKIPETPSIHPIQELTHWSKGMIEKLFWSQQNADIHDIITANFVTKNFQRGDKGIIRIYAVRPDTNKETLIKHISFTIEQNESFMQIQIPCHMTSTNSSNTENSYTFKTTAYNIQTLKPTQYYFEVEIENTLSNQRSNLLTLTTILSLKLIYTHNQPLPDGSQIILIDSQHHKHIEYCAQGKAIFKKVALGECWIQIKCLRSKNKYYDAEVLNSDNSLPYYGGTLIPSHQTDQTNTYQITVLPPFLFCNIRENSDSWDPKTPLDSHSIEMIKQNGNNITLFIHGYHIQLGQSDKYYNKVHLPFISTLTSELSDTDCTVYRKLSLLCKRFPELKRVKKRYAKQIAKTINGSHAHRWAILMEDNLNRATGFTYQNYQKYTRMLHISWSGDYGRLNFIKAVKHTAKAGKRLVTLIRYLKQQGIQTINIIAHSLGAEVLLFAMNELGKANQTLIDHAFLWQAAVPNDALSDKQKYYPRTHHTLSKNDAEISDDDINQTLWYDFTKAHQGAKYITVLYSRNDNVLGPIPDEAIQSAEGLNQTEINHTKPFFDESLPAQILTDIGLHSGFEFATWLKANITDLFNTKKQDEIYQNFLMLYKTEMNKTTQKPFAENLDEAIEQYYQKMPFKHRINFLTWKKFQMKWPELFKQTNPDQSLDSYQTMESIVNTAMTQTSIIRFFDMLKILIDDFGFKTKPAMGYAGIDEYTKQKMKNKLYLVPQHKWLWSHSGIKRPSKALMKNVYQQWIIHKIHGIKKFGRIDL